jgi:hypothetical protein
VKDRWIAIRHGGKICFAQWEDVGPFQTDHWQYVFGNERPRPNRNQNAGLDVSPAVRDYLSLNGLDICDWKFVDHPPPGPWSNYDSNNLALPRPTQESKVAMSVDIRRMSREDLDRLNAEGKAWRERSKPGVADTLSTSDKPQAALHKADDASPLHNQPDQMDLWEKGDK